MAQQPAPLLKQAANFVLDVANGRHALSKLVPVGLWLMDGGLTSAIIWKVPCMKASSVERCAHVYAAPQHLANSCNGLDTEIDWVAYMEQVAQFVDGERDYTKIEGGTGPLVYPAAHVYMYTGLYYVTDHGKNIMLAQQIFAGLYMATLALVMMCYWKAKVS